jgi:hypothetical protein
MVTGVENASGCAAGHFRLTTRDVLAVTTTNLNRVNLLDLLNTNSATVLGSSTASGLGPHSLASLASPFGSPPPAYSALLVASMLNDPPAERIDIVTNFPIGLNPSAGQFPETGPFGRANALPISSNGPTFAVGLVRGTNDTFHLWQFTNAPSVLFALSNLPPGSDYVFGNFNGESLPRFIFYQPGSSNLAIYPLIATSSGGFAFGGAVLVTASEAVQQVFYVQLGSDGSALLQFGDGVQGMRLPSGVPSFSGTYRSGGGAAGNMFTGIVPLASGQFALFDAPPGTAASVHEQVIQFDGSTFTQLSRTNLPALSSRSTRANVWLFQLEPFVNRDAGFIASFNAPDWSDSVTGLPPSLTAVIETDAGTNSGLGSTSTNNLGVPPTGATNGLPNQYNPAISVFSYSGARSVEPVDILISPPPGPYSGPLNISFSWPGSGREAWYRVGPSGPWQLYSAPFPLTNDATIQYYGTTIVNPTRSQIQLASYTIGLSGAAPPAPVNPNPGNTNTPPVLSSNALVLSENGTVFYGRVNAANNYTVWAINLDGSGDTYITTGARPRVSHDGRYLAFLRGGSPLVTQGNAWVRDLKTGAETLLYTNSNYTIGYDWDLTGTNLIFDWNCWLWTINQASGGIGTQLPLPSPDCYDDAPVVNPMDGSLAFHNLGPSVPGLYVTSPSLTSKQRLNLNVPGASWPAWSPDAKWLSFVDGNSSNTAFTADSGTNIWVVHPDGSDLNQISAFTDGTNRFPHGAIWSPDGMALVGAGTIFGTNGLWMIPLTPDQTDCDGPPILLPTTPGDSIDFAGSVVLGPSQFTGIVATQTPGLFIRLAPNAVVVYWNTNYVGFTLESEFNVPARAWAPVPGPYYLANGYFEYWEARNALSPEKLFRLHLTGAVVLSQPPTLQIQVQTNTAVISWQAVYAGFTLQSRTGPLPSSSWNDLPTPYTVNGVNFQYVEPISTQQKFYRLRGP